MKFKVGDKVKVKDNSKYLGRIHAGETGRIVEIVQSLDSHYPYGVIIGRGVLWWHANELELIKEEQDV